jgi:hypothetical protein
MADRFSKPILPMGFCQSSPLGHGSGVHNAYDRRRRCLSRRTCGIPFRDIRWRWAHVREALDAADDEAVVDQAVQPGLVGRVGHPERTRREACTLEILRCMW